MSYTTDASIGNNLERLRGDMSMDMLAAKMRERGYSWTKTTVFNIEHGKRPLRLSEAADVLVCLKVEPSSYVFELLRSEKEYLWIGKVGQVSYAEDQVKTACENYVNQINYLLDFLDSDIAKATSSEAEKRVDHYRKYTATQLKVARSLAPYVEGILDFFEQSGDKLPLVFVDGGFKRLEYEDFNKDVEFQLESIGITSEEINSLKERAKKIRDSSLTSK